MEPQKTHRKLTAIFSTDVQGYSRLMGDDEEATIHTLTACMEVIAAKIEKHGGRVVDSPDDNFVFKKRGMMARPWPQAPSGF